MKKIVQKDSPALRQKAERVKLEEISSKKIQGIISNMKETLNAERDGVGLAAPQIGIPLRIFIVSRRAFLLADGVPDAKRKDLVFINPKFVKRSKKKAQLYEGCLSVRWLYGNVKRSTNATITAYDEAGKKITRGAGSLLAQIFQHELDHLDGILFIDKATDIEEILPDATE